MDGVGGRPRRAATARFLDLRHEAWEEGMWEGAVVGACQLFRRDGCRGEGLEADPP
ncbi:hypothetical protein [Streptomyces manipurensis]|uniref:hypothetical protein n=1 Tax=Streptomyces manipurensis TaxID=1077945 RepID=UPI003C6F98D0